jgi:hypothetical protein
VNVSSSDIPTNLTGTIPGPLNPGLYLPFTTPNTSVVGAGGGSAFVGPVTGLNKLYCGGRTASGQPHPAEQDVALVRPA